MHLIAQFLSRLKCAFSNLQVAKPHQSLVEEAREASDTYVEVEHLCVDFRHEAQIGRARRVGYECVEDQAVCLAYLKSDLPDEERLPVFLTGDEFQRVNTVREPFQSGSGR